MATKVVDTVSANTGTTRNVFTLSNGNCMVVVLEGLNVKVYETSAADRVTGWTQRCSLSMSTELTSAHSVSAALFSDNSLGIMVAGNDASNDRLIYFKLTYSGYTTSSKEVAFSVASASQDLQTQYASYDIDVTDTGAILVALVWSFGSYSDVRMRLLCRNTGSTWGTATDTVVQNLSTSIVDWNVTIASMGITTVTRRVVIASSTPYKNASGIYVDTGVQLWTSTVNETTGAWTAPTNRATYISGTAGGFGSANGVTTKSLNIKLFRTAGSADQYHLAMARGLAGSGFGGGTDPNFAAYSRGSWDGTTWAVITTPTIQYFSSSGGPLGNCGGGNGNSIGITLGSAGIAFNLAAVWSLSPLSYHIGVMQVVWSVEFGTPNVSWNVGSWADNAAIQDISVYSGGRRNVGNKHDSLMLKTDTKPYHYMAPTLPLPSSITPDNGATVATATPLLQITAQFLDSYYAPSKMKGTWQISQDSGFASGVRVYNDTELNAWYEMNGSNSVPVTMSEDTSSGYTPLTAGAWYIRARVDDTYGNSSAWTTTTRLFTIGHPPVATPLSPLNNTMAEYGAGTKSFSWKFTDASPTDVQTAYQLRIKTGDASGTIIYDSGKISSSLKTVTVAIPVGNKNQTLYWEVRLWDTDDAAGAYSSGASFFMMVDPATAAITAPTASQVLSAGTMTLSATVAATGGRVVKEYLYRIFKAGVVVWTSDRVLGTWGNGVALPYIIPAGVLVNSSAYTVQVLVVDDAGVNSISAPVAFTTSWTAALSATVFSLDVTNYNTLGYVTLSWTDANRESGFVAWNIYRSVDLIDPFTQAVLQTGTYKLVYQDFRAQAGTYTWDDYYAPGGQKVNYLIKQLANRGGFFVESQNATPASGFPVTDGYWMIEPTSTLGLVATKLYLVTDDSFTDEQEEASYVVQGRGRHVDKGEYLGPNGTLTLQIRHTGSTSARQKRLKLLEIQQSVTPIYLRNPFGDVLKVNLSSMQVGRLAGVGTSEFCDVTIPYSKVG